MQVSGSATNQRRRKRLRKLPLGVIISIIPVGIAVLLFVSLIIDDSQNIKSWETICSVVFGGATLPAILKKLFLEKANKEGKEQSVVDRFLSSEPIRQACCWGLLLLQIELFTVRYPMHTVRVIADVGHKSKRVSAFSSLVENGNDTSYISMKEIDTNDFISQHRYRKDDKVMIDFSDRGQKRGAYLPQPLKVQPLPLISIGRLFLPDRYLPWTDVQARISTVTITIQAKPATAIITVENQNPPQKAIGILSLQVPYGTFLKGNIQSSGYCTELFHVAGTKDLDTIIPLKTVSQPQGYFQVIVRNAGGDDIADARIRIDGTKALWGAWVPATPGTHQITACKKTGVNSYLFDLKNESIASGQKRKVFFALSDQTYSNEPEGCQ